MLVARRRLATGASAAELVGAWVLLSVLFLHAAVALDFSLRSDLVVWMRALDERCVCEGTALACPGLECAVG